MSIKHHGNSRVITGTKTDGNPWTVDTGATYAANDVVGTPLMFASAGGYLGGGYISGVVIGDAEGEFDGVTLELWLYDDSISTSPADNAAWAEQSADRSKRVGIISVGTWYDADGTAAVVQAEDILRGYEVSSNERGGLSQHGGALYGRLVARGAAVGTYAANSSLAVKLFVELN